MIYEVSMSRYGNCAKTSNVLLEAVDTGTSNIDILATPSNQSQSFFFNF